MGDLQGISKARKELEELYSGIPDESVNLTFQDFAEVRLQNNVAAEKKHNTPKKEEAAVSLSPLTKLPSLDFNRGLNKPSSTSTPTHHRDDHYYQNHQQNVVPHRFNHHPHHPLHAYNHVKMDHHHGAGRLKDGSSSMGGYDDVSGISMASNMSGFSEINGMRRRRPGIPHSNICTVCSNYIYIFRHRCLVCGRVYCRQCVGIGMGDMAEGRKCIECLGKRFSQRYIQRAGEVGCCMGYHSTVKQQELKWAEKGPKRTGEDRYGRSGMVNVSRSRSPYPKPPPPPPINNNNNNNSNSFVMMNSPYSPYYSPTNHPLPF